MKIFAVGMNYIMHNKELDGALYKTEEPVIFTKADSSLLKDGKPFFVPTWMGRVDYETELVVRICRLGKSIPERFAHRYYDAVTVGIDFTARDLQRRLRDSGHPWEICKGFDGAAVIGRWIEVDNGEVKMSDGQTRNIQDLSFHLDINGRTVQQGRSGDMLYGVDQLISYISRFFTIKTGDLLYSGTPAGIGPVNVNDRLVGYIGEQKVLEFNVK